MFLVVHSTSCCGCWRSVECYKNINQCRSNGKYLVYRTVTCALISGGGGGGECLYISVLLGTNFFWNQFDYKEIGRAEHEYRNTFTPPPPPRYTHTQTHTHATKAQLNYGPAFIFIRTKWWKLEILRVFVCFGQRVLPYCSTAVYIQHYKLWLWNNMYITRALIGRSPCLGQPIQTRKS